MTFRSLAFVLALITAPCGAEAAGSGVAGHVSDPAGLPLPGLLISVLSAEPRGVDARPAISGVTDERGGYTFELAPGTYKLTAELSGFVVVERMVVVGEGDITTADVSLAIASFQDSVTVHADTTPPSMLATPQPNAPVTVSRTVIN